MLKRARRVFFVIIALLLTTLLTACASATATPQAAPTNAPSPTTSSGQAITTQTTVTANNTAPAITKVATTPPVIVNTTPPAQATDPATACMSASTFDTTFNKSANHNKNVCLEGQVASVQSSGTSAKINFVGASNVRGNVKSRTVVGEDFLASLQGNNIRLKGRFNHNVLTASDVDIEAANQIEFIGVPVAATSPQATSQVVAQAQPNQVATIAATTTIVPPANTALLPTATTVPATPDIANCLSGPVFAVRAEAGDLAGKTVCLEETVNDVIIGVQDKTATLLLTNTKIQATIANRYSFGTTPLKNLKGQKVRVRGAYTEAEGNALITLADPTAIQVNSSGTTFSAFKAVPEREPTPTVATTPLSFVSVQGTSPGRNASVTVQTAPNASCSIIYLTPSNNNSTAAGLVDKAADASGRVYWSWLIGGNTKRGTGTVIVTCNSATASSPIVIG